MMCYDLMWLESCLEISLAHSTKVKHRHARENKKAEVRGVCSPVCGRYKHNGVKERRSDG